MPTIKISVHIDEELRSEHNIDTFESAWDEEVNKILSEEVGYILDKVKVKPDKLKILQDKLQLVAELAHCAGLFGYPAEKVVLAIRNITEDEAKFGFSYNETPERIYNYFKSVE